ncbi:MAG: ABC transporter ATP-binding protein [Clostridiales Family XIII bacterium]|jgi:peptide/nickel transport system ATP-binding protein|nr:ABC transporter ATP-binding protein [Clostridiales Family XIII bacterium]
MGTELNHILSITGLRVAFAAPPAGSGQRIQSGARAGDMQEALRGISFSIDAGEMLALVGESGSGKTLLCRTVFGLLEKDAVVLGGKIDTSGDASMSIVLQDPMASLDPAVRIGKQIAEAIPKEKRGSKGQRSKRICELLDLVGIPDPERTMKDFPSQFSGGMRQRVAIAIALAMEPDIIFADEPTTSLDAELSHTVMELLQKIGKESDAAILFITHDLGLVRAYADRILIIEDGLIIEEGPPREIFEAPKQDYTKRLIRYAQHADGQTHTHGKIHFHDGVPHTHERGHGDGQNEGAPHLASHEHGHARTHRHFSYEIAGRENDLSLYENDGPPPSEPLVAVKGVSKRYSTGRGRVNTVLRDVSFDIFDGETLGLSGRSGIGKSTLARLLCKIERPGTGEIVYSETLARRESVQMIFQDSRSALNPRMKVRDVVAEAIRIRDGSPPEDALLRELLARVELPPELLDRYPHEISGGERQRIAIARAVSISPKLLIADEPVSSLDVTVRNKIVHLLQRLKEEAGLTLVLISHDLPLLMHVSDRILTLKSEPAPATNP